MISLFKRNLLKSVHLLLVLPNGLSGVRLVPSMFLILWVGDPVDSEFLPRITSVNSNQEMIDNNMTDLQQEMMDNNWSLREDEDGEFFSHRQYPSKKVQVHTHIALDGRIFKIPLMMQSDDHEGLGCCIDYMASQSFYTIRSNRFIEYNESRTGKRCENYLVYLGQRLKRKAEFQKEAEAIAKTMEVKKRQMNKTISNV